MSRFLILCIWLFSISSCSAQQSQKTVANAVANFVADSCFIGASLGVVVANAETGKLLATHNATTALTPASCQKLITTATALNVLGSDYRFKTTISINGKLENGIIKGNLTINGYGDPTLQSKYFKHDKSFVNSVVDMLQQQNITRIEGEIQTNTNYFNSSIPRTWIWEDIGNYYGAVPHAINYRDNLYTLFFKSGEANTPTKITQIIPENTGLSFQNNVKSSAINKDLAYIFGGDIANKRRIEGTIPKNRQNFKVKGALSHPDICLINDLKQALKQRNIQVANKKIRVKNKKTLFTFYSPLLPDIVRETNKKSINLFADNLLFAIAKQQSGDADWTIGCQAILDFWKSAGVNISNAKLLDGSGLSHFNAVSADFFNQVLCRMYRDENFTASLPVATKSGTLKYFGRNSSFKTNFRAKTGSMGGVRSYCGYLKNHAGKTLAVTIIINNYFCDGKTVKQKVEHLINELWE